MSSTKSTGGGDGEADLRRVNHEACDVTEARQRLEALCHRVADLKHRVEIHVDGSRDTVVLISRSELECLEHALEILGDSDGIKDLCAKLARVAEAAGPGVTGA